MTTPRVSLLVTSYNHAPFVEQALDSVLAQTCRDMEVVITDDASQDGSADVIEAWLARTGFPATFVRNRENVGICRGRNQGIALCTGDLICTLAGDDVLEPERVSHQVACFERQPEHVAALYSDAVMINADGTEHLPSFLGWQLGDEPPPQGRIFARLLRNNFLCAPTVMVRRSAIDAVGGYDESLAYEDVDMWLRLSHRFEFAYLPEKLVRYRIVPSSISHDPAGRKRMRASDEPILDKWLHASLTAEEQRALMDALWRTAKMFLYMHEDAAAARTFAKIARLDPRQQRRWAGLALQLTAGRQAARWLAASVRRLRGMPEPV